MIRTAVAPAPFFRGRRDDGQIAGLLCDLKTERAQGGAYCLLRYASAGSSCCRHCCTTEHVPAHSPASPGPGHSVAPAKPSGQEGARGRLSLVVPRLAGSTHSAATPQSQAQARPPRRSACWEVAPEALKPCGHTCSAIRAAHRWFSSMRTRLERVWRRDPNLCLATGRDEVLEPRNPRENAVR